MEEYDGVPGESDQETSGKDVSNNDSYADHEDGDAAEQTGENDMQEETNGQCDVPPDPAMRGPFWGPHMRGPGPHGPHGPMGPGPGPHGGRGMWRGPPPPPRFRGRGPPGPPWPPRGGPWRGPAPPPFFRGPRPPFRGPPPPFDPNWGPPGSGGMMGPCPPGPRGGAPPGGGGGGGGMRPPFAPPMSHPHHPHPHHPHHPPHHPHHPHHQQQQQQNQQQQAGLDLSTVWVETTTDQGKSYFYNAQSRQTSWTRPEGPDVRVLSQTEVEEMTRGSGEDGAADQGQFASQQQQQQHQHQEQQHRHHHIPHHHHHPGVAGADASGESGYEHGEMPPGITAAAAAASVNGTDGSVVTPATAPTAAAATAGVHGGPFGYHMPPPSAGWPDPAAAAVNWAPPHQAGAGMDAAAWTAQQSQLAGVAATAAGAAASATQPVIQSAPALDNKQLDPQLVARAAEWTEHSAPDGRKYYYNASTQQSVWNKPQPMIELEAARLAAQQQVAAVAAAAVAAGTVPDTVPGMTSEQLSTAAASAAVAGVSSLAGSVNNTVVDGDRRTDGAVDGDGMDVDDEDGVPAAAVSAAQTDGDKSAQQEDLSSSATTTAAAQAEAEQQRKKKEEEERAAAAAAAAKKQQDKSRPVSSTPVPGSPWCVVWTGDRRVFFFNPSTRTSVWQRPADLTGRADVDKMLVPASSAASDDDDNNAVDSGNQTASATSQQSSGGGGGDVAASATTATSSSSSVAVVEGQQEREAAATTAVLSDQPPPAKKTKLDDSTVDSGDDGPKKIDIGKEAAIEAEARAARERAVVPLDTRMKQFRDMLVEKEVSAFSTWEKELHKIVFDARYLLLTSRERRQVFDKYTKERAEEERREKRSRMRENRDHFKQLLQDLGVTVKSSFSDFAQKHSKEERFRAVDKMRDRESLFNEYIQDLRRKEKEDRFARREQVKRDFFALLSEQSWLDRHARWSDVRRRLDEETRFRAVESSGQREDWFRDHLHDLKERRRRDKRQRDKKRSGGGGGGERRRASCSATRDNNDDDVDSGASSGEVSRAENGGAGNEGGNGQGEAGAGGGSPMNEAHSTAGSLKEEGERSDEDSDHGDEEVRRAEREKKERAEASIREREKEVQRTLAEHLRDRDKERQQHKHDEAVQNMNAVLADLVRSADASWREARKLLKKDQRWSLCQSLDKPQREKLFLAHVDALNKKKTDKLRELLDEQNIAFGSTWKEAKKLIRDDPRYSKVTFGDKQRNERAFREYLKDKATVARAEFRQLLAETKCITHESLHRVADNQQHMKDILDVLRQDNRYIRLEPLAEEREQLIVSYLEELEQRGPPPPPTASEPCRRSAK